MSHPDGSARRDNGVELRHLGDQPPPITFPPRSNRTMLGMSPRPRLSGRGYGFGTTAEISRSARRRSRVRGASGPSVIVGVRRTDEVSD